MEPEIEVWHFLLAREARADESWRTASLGQPASFAMRGVGYVLEVGADVEFPTDVKPPGAVYLRVRGISCGPMSLLLQVAHCDPRGIWSLHSIIPVRTANPIAFSESGDEVHDVVVQLPYLTLGGAGLNAMGISFSPPDLLPVDVDAFVPTTISEWKSNPEEMFAVENCVFGAVEYIWVERLP